MKTNPPREKSQFMNKAVRTNPKKQKAQKLAAEYEEAAVESRKINRQLEGTLSDGLHEMGTGSSGQS